MISILFVCHGNICRSPMAEFIFKNLIKSENPNISFYVESAATSTEALGCHIYGAAKAQLDKHNISGYEDKISRQLTNKDYDKYDYLFVMDSLNLRNIKKIIVEDPQNKIHRILDYSLNPRDVADPWYTRDFNFAYDEILEGCQSILKYIMQTHCER